MPKTLRCRLRLHDWSDLQNPETKEWYQVCARCDAYHEKPTAAPGAGAAGATGANFG